MAIKAVLFDMDGVLVDTEKLILKASMAALAEYGIQTEPDDFTPYIGAGENNYIGQPCKNHGGEFVPEMKLRAYEIYSELLAETPEAVYDGVLETLNYVKGKYFTALCSAADRIKVCHNLNAIGITPEFFNAFITGNDVDKHKPNPDVFLKAAEKINTAPCDCVVIEDAKNGILVAKAAGMKNIAVTTAFTEKELKDTVAPDYIIGSIKDLPTVLESLRFSNQA